MYDRSYEAKNVFISPSNASLGRFSVVVAVKFTYSTDGDDPIGVPVKNISCGAIFVCPAAALSTDVLSAASAPMLTASSSPNNAIICFIFIRIYVHTQN